MQKRESMKRNKIKVRRRSVDFDLSVFTEVLRLDLERSKMLTRDESRTADVAREGNASVETYFALRQLEALRQKNVDAPGSHDSLRRFRALRKFEASERSCHATNIRHPFYGERFGGMASEVIGESISLAQRILGPLNRGTLHKIFSQCKFGSGMTFGDQSISDTSLQQKLSGRQTITKAAVQYLPIFRYTNPLFYKKMDGDVEVVRGNRVTMVPKDAKTLRPIAIEPSYNMLFQRGVDVYMRGKLLRHGVDLSDQSKGWEPARVGSQDGSWATIDLSSASDLISDRVVHMFLNPDWYSFLDDLRSPEYQLGKRGKWRTYNKFSSMGNSFTFPLETLIFFSIAKTATDYTRRDSCPYDPEREPVVYGDDIVVPQEAYALVVECLEVLGFKVNPAKSYATGWFRETCGCDFYKGIDVRPVYLDRNPRYETCVYNLYNRLLNNRQGLVYDHALRYLMGLVPQPYLVPRYSSFSGWWTWKPYERSVFDAGFQVPYSYARQYIKFFAHEGFQDLACKTYIWSTRMGKWRGTVTEDQVIFLSLYTGSSLAYDKSVVSHVRRRVTFSGWHDYGLWPSFLRRFEQVP